MTTIAGLELLERLHEGPRSIVHRAQRPDGTLVVVKTHRSDLPTPGEVAELRREHRLLGCISSPRVVSALDLVPHGNGVALVLEDIGACSLVERLRTGAPLSLTEGLTVARDLAAALEAVHAQGIVHRDIKPANVVVHPQTLELRLIDFNTSARLDAAEPTNAELEGTLAYLSPEQTGRMNRPVDRRADLYSFGVLLFELLSGRLPFAMDDPLELMHAHCARTPPPLREHAPGAPPVLEAITARLLMKDAEDRYQSARGLRLDLQRCLDSMDVDGVPYFEPGGMDTSEQFQLSRRLVGRAEPLDRLQRAFRSARQGVQVVLVSGAPGIGKSALIREVSRPIARSRGYFVEGKFDQFERDRPYASLVQAFQQLTRQLLTESAGRVQAWSHALSDALGANLAVITDVLTELALLVGPQPAPAPLPPLEARHRFDDSFQRFVRVFARPDAPLALFLDDLQWVDSASLRLVRTLATDPQVAGLLIVGTYRDNEVGPHHPLQRALEEMLAAGVATDTVELGPLALRDASELVRDTLRCAPADAEPLARLLLRKTAGNPFFLSQFLRSLHADGALVCAPDGGGWTWDLAAIERRDITDNVADLLSQRIRQLPEETAALLQLAACLGNTLSLGELAEASGRPVEDAGRAIWPALEGGHLLPLGRAHRWLQDADAPHQDLAGLRLRFLHDRVQQAAYHLLDEAARRPIHLAIGRRIDVGELRGAALFAAARHYGAAEALLTDPQERDRVAALQLAAARQARRSNAYGVARGMLDRGLALAERPELRRDLQTERGVCACLLGDRAEAAGWFEQALSASPDPLDRADIRAEWLQSLLNEGDHRGAVDLGAACLADLGRPMPRGRDAAVEAGGAMLQEVLAALGPKGAASVLDLPPMTDRRSRALARILGMFSPSAYILDPEDGQFLWVAASCLALAQEAGAAVDTPHGCSLVGMVLYAIGERGLGHGFLETGLRLAERDGDLLQRAKTTTCLGFYESWSKPVDTALATARLGWERGLEAGDYFHAAWAARNVLRATTLSTRPPAEAVVEADAFVVFLRPHAPELVSTCQSIARRHLALMGQTDGPTSFAGPDFDEPAFWSGIELRQIEVEILIANMEQGWLHLLYGEWHAAEERLARAQGVLATLAELDEGGELAFLHGLCAAGRGDRDGLRAAMATLEPRSQAQEDNWGPRARLLEAELTAMEGGLDAAITAFDRAIDAAQDQPLIRALAQERAGRLLLDGPRERFARVYLSEACNAYELWGATCKAAALADEFPDRRATGLTSTALRAVRPDEAMTATVHTLPAFGGAQLELETFAQAARAIASEVERPGLLRALLRLAVANAGATAGALVTWEEGGPRLRGRAVAGAELVITTVDEALERTSCVPRSMVLGAARLKEPTVVQDTAEDLRFARDPYFLVNPCRSALALPLLHGGRLGGVLYLESDRTTGAFTPARTELLSLLSSQVAIALENARLYEETRAALEHVQRLNDAHRRFVPRELLAALGKPSVLTVGLGESTSGQMTVLFADIRGFTALSERLGPQETFAFLNRYLAVAGPVVRACGGFIDKYIGDAIMAVFPRAADDALDAARGLQMAVDRFNDEWVAEGHSPVRIGVGVHVGQVVLGTVGEAERMEGTVISDAVNVASRLEGQCKVLGVGIVVSEAVFAACSEPMRQPRRALGAVEVRGRSGTINAFELVVARRQVG